MMGESRRKAREGGVNGLEFGDAQSQKGNGWEAAWARDAICDERNEKDRMICKRMIEGHRKEKCEGNM